MKKLALSLALVFAVAAASATEIGIRATHSKGDAGSAAGITIGQKFGNVGVEGAFDRSTRGTNNMNRWSVTGSYDLVNVGLVTISPKVGVAYLKPSQGWTGAALLVGVGASMPLDTNVALTADYMYQNGGHGVTKYNGNRFTVGVKYTF
jgi:opacity protein-like surface antigen